MEQERFIRIPHISISATSVTQYFRTLDRQTAKFTSPMRVTENGEEKIKPDNFKKHIGTLSSKARRQLKRSVNNLLLSVDENMLVDGSSRENISFITLTLPAMQFKEVKNNAIHYYHTDKEIKSRCLNQFLIETKKKYGVDNFVWVAEKQENLNLHFHLLYEKPVPSMEIRTIWNRIINKLGYVDRYHEKMCKLSFEDYQQLRKKERKSIEQLKKAYDFGVKTNWMQPNSADVHPLRKVNDVSAYITKYMSKGVDLEDKKVVKLVTSLSVKYEISPEAIQQAYSIDGRIWQCSTAISKSRKCTDFLEDTYKTEINNLLNSEPNEDEFTVFAEEHFTTLTSKYSTLRKRLTQTMSFFLQHIKNVIYDTLHGVVSTASNIISNNIIPAVLAQRNTQTVLQFI